MQTATVASGHHSTLPCFSAFDLYVVSILAPAVFGSFATPNFSVALNEEFLRSLTATLEFSVRGKVYLIHLFPELLVVSDLVEVASPPLGDVGACFSINWDGTHRSSPSAPPQRSIPDSK